MALKNAAAAAALMAGVNFGDLGMYSGGQFIPDGDYILGSLDAILWGGKDGNKKVRLGVQVTFLPMDNPVEEAKLTQFYSMGSKADQSFAPNPDTGKGIIPIPGAPGTTLNDKTNWFTWLKSLLDSGLPPGIFTNDLSVLEGAWVHVANVDEDPERANFASGTAEVAQEQRKPGKIAVVTEIKEGGAPWEGGGGIPAAGTVAQTKVAPKGAAPKVTPKATPKAAPPVAAEPAGDDAADIQSAASSAATDVIVKKPKGCLRLFLQNEVFKIVSRASGEPMAQSVQNTYFAEGQEDNLNTLLGELGYKLAGNAIVVA